MSQVIFRRGDGNRGEINITGAHRQEVVEGGLIITTHDDMTPEDMHHLALVLGWKQEHSG